MRIIIMIIVDRNKLFSLWHVPGFLTDDDDDDDDDRKSKKKTRKS